MLLIGFGVFVVIVGIAWAIVRNPAIAANWTLPNIFGPAILLGIYLTYKTFEYLFSNIMP